MNVELTFAAFQRKFVDLDPDHVKAARASCDFLVEQIAALRQSFGFPPFTGANVPFGSFSRGTKIRPLDDVDVLFLLNGSGTTEVVREDGVTVWLRIDTNTAPLGAFRDSYGYVNSTRILNATRDGLGGVGQYKKADVKKNMEAVTLALSSYPWVFDIVPAVAVNGTGASTAHYLIPDGRGEWKRADPRRDTARAETLKAAYGGVFASTCRLLKFWNLRTHKPRLPSYYFEWIVTRVFPGNVGLSSKSSAVHTFFQQAPGLIAQTCPDPNQLGANLDEGIEWQTKQSVIQAMKQAESDANTALVYPMLLGSPVMVPVTQWRKVFGPDFGS